MRHENPEERARIMMGLCFSVLIFVFWYVLISKCMSCCSGSYQEDKERRKRKQLEAELKRKTDELAEVRKTEQCVHCKPNQPTQPKSPQQEHWYPWPVYMTGTSLFLIAILLMTRYVGVVDISDQVLFGFGDWVLGACIAQAAVGFYLRCAPEVILKLRRKPRNGKQYQAIAEAIVKEEDRRGGKPFPVDTMFDNNGFDDTVQAALFALAALFGGFLSGFAVVVLVLADHYSGKHGLKALIKAYVSLCNDHTYTPSNATDSPTSAVVERLRSAAYLSKPKKEETKETPCAIEEITQTDIRQFMPTPSPLNDVPPPGF